MSPEADIDELLRPPTDAEVVGALERFAADLQLHYGNRLKGLYLFGSRARGGHTPESDADVAVVLADDGWKHWEEKWALTDYAHDILIETGAEIQAWPVNESHWNEPGRHPNPSLVRAMRRDQKPIVARK
jgi:uncharacterized protein